MPYSHFRQRTTSLEQLDAYRDRNSHLFPSQLFKPQHSITRQALAAPCPDGVSERCVRFSISGDSDSAVGIIAQLEAKFLREVLLWLLAEYQWNALDHAVASMRGV